MSRELTLQEVLVHFFLMCAFLPAVCSDAMEDHAKGCIDNENTRCCEIAEFDDYHLKYCCHTKLGNYPIYKDELCCSVVPIPPYCCKLEDCCDLSYDKIPKPETKDLCRRRKERNQQKGDHCLETTSGISYTGHVSFADDKIASKCMQWPGTNTAECRHDPETGDMRCVTNAISKAKAICNITRCGYPAACAPRFRRGSWEYNRSCLVVDNRTVCPTTEPAELNASNMKWVDCLVHEEMVQCIRANQATATITCVHGEYIAVVRAAMITEEKIKKSWCEKKEFTADSAVSQAPSINVTDKVRALCDDINSPCLIRPKRDFAELVTVGSLGMLYVDYVCQSRTPREAVRTPKYQVKTYNSISLPPKGCRGSQFGLDYDGTLSHTKSGFQCANWSTLDDNAKKEEMKTYHFMYGIDEAGDYCRNPSASPSGPWCYTFVNSNAKNSELQRETCDIPQCPTVPKDCVFPFFADENKYFDCTLKNARPMCSKVEVIEQKGNYEDLITCEFTQEVRICSNSKKSINCNQGRLLVVNATAVETGARMFCQVDAGIDSKYGRRNVTERVRSECNGKVTCTMENTEKLTLYYIKYICSRNESLERPDFDTASRLLKNGQKTSAEPANIMKCKYGDIGENYTGDMHMTVSGHKCAAWNDVGSTHITYPSLRALANETHNHCRNPNFSTDGPWCFVAYRETRSVPIAESCGLKLCRHSGGIPEVFQYNGTYYRGCLMRKINSEMRPAHPIESDVKPGTSWVPCSDFQTIRSCNESYIELNCDDPYDPYTTIRVYHVKMVDTETIGTAKCLRSGATDDPQLGQKIHACSSQNMCRIRRSHSNVVIVEYGCVRASPNSVSGLN